MKVTNTKKIDLPAIYSYLNSKAQSAKVIHKDDFVIVLKDTVRADIKCLGLTEIEVKGTLNFKNLQNAVIMSILAVIGGSYGGFLLGFVGGLIGGGINYAINGTKIKQFEQKVCELIEEI